MKKSFSLNDLRSKPKEDDYSLTMRLTHKQLSRVEKTFSALVRDFTNLTVQVNSSSRINTELINSLDDFCKDETFCLKDGIYSICDSLTKVDVLDSMLSNTIQGKVVAPLSQYSQTCKNQRENLERISLLHAKAEKTFKKELKSSKKRKSIDTPAKRDMLRLIKEFEDLNERLHEFERNKVKDLKTILSHYIHGNLVYHAKALETFSNAYKSLESIDIDEHIEQFSVANSPQDRSERFRIVRTHSLTSFISPKKL